MNNGFLRSRKLQKAEVKVYKLNEKDEMVGASILDSSHDMPLILKFSNGAKLDTIKGVEIPPMKPRDEKAPTDSCQTNKNGPWETRNTRYKTLTRNEVMTKICQHKWKRTEKRAVQL